MFDTVLQLPDRSVKPRTVGFTSIMDMGIPLGQQRDILESYSSFIDLAKIGTGAAYINPVLPEKIALYKEFDIPVCLGGTLFEKFFQQEKVTEYKEFLTRLDVNWVEVSSGIVDVPHQRMLQIIEDFKQDFVVLAEVGKKFRNASLQEWIEGIDCYQKAGVRYVILEGRTTATAGIYNDQGDLDLALMNEILKQVNANTLLFEAATEHAQAQMISMLGSNVNLANIDLRDLVGLEAFRLGLRAETFV